MAISSSDEILKQLIDPRYEFDAQQTRAIYDAYKMRADRLSRYALINFSVGDKVTFDSKQGVKLGVVERINSKSISVKVIDKRIVFGADKSTTIDVPVKWKVAPSLLQKAA